MRQKQTSSSAKSKVESSISKTKKATEKSRKQKTPAPAKNQPVKAPTSASVRRKPSSASKTTRKKFPEAIEPMLASSVDKPFTKDGWVFEPKFDGIRAIAYVQDDQVKLLSRRGLDLTSRYPELVESLLLHKVNIIVDGEIVAFDEKGKTSFQLLQRESGTRARTLKSAFEPNLPIRFFVFDVLSLNGKNVMKKTFADRKKILRESLIETDDVRRVDDLGADGNRAFIACLENGLEGVIAKQQGSPYVPGKRSDNWLKLKATRTSEFIVCGYTAGKNENDKTFGALILGVHNDEGELMYAGSVGTGFDEKTRANLLKMMAPHKSAKCPFSVRPLTKSVASWLEPKIIVEIKYAEMTMDNKLRMPVFLQVRMDKEPSEITAEGVVDISLVEPVAKGNKQKHAVEKSKEDSRVISINTKKPIVVEDVKDNVKKEVTKPHFNESVLKQLDNDEDDLEITVDSHRIKLTSLNKELFPGTKSSGGPITKRNYIEYLVQASEFILRHIHARPFTLIRFPNGINGQKFFQKHWTQNLPKFVQTVEYFSEHGDQDEQFLLCNNLPTLIWCGQIASLELHSVHSRLEKEPDGQKLSMNISKSLKNIENSILNYPDYLILDLDPYLYSGKEAPNEEPELHRKGFTQSRKLALFLKTILDELGLNSFVKTSGKTGIHIYVPIIRNCDNDVVRSLAGTIAKHVAKIRPNDVTIDWAVKKRTGKVFFDFNMNARHKTLAAPYSVRASLTGAVSCPVEWDELDSVYPTDFTIRTAPQRFAKVGDLWENILDKKTDIHKILMPKDL